MNRDIKAANSLMQSIRQMVRHLKGWIAELKEKKAALLEALQESKEPTLPELLGKMCIRDSSRPTALRSQAPGHKAPGCV